MTKTEFNLRISENTHTEGKLSDHVQVLFKSKYNKSAKPYLEDRLENVVSIVSSCVNTLEKSSLLKDEGVK